MSRSIRAHRCEISSSTLKKNSHFSRRLTESLENSEPNQHRCIFNFLSENFLGRALINFWEVLNVGYIFVLNFKIWSSKSVTNFSLFRKLPENFAGGWVPVGSESLYRDLFDVHRLSNSHQFKKSEVCQNGGSIFGLSD